MYSCAVSRTVRVILYVFLLPFRESKSLGCQENQNQQGTSLAPGPPTCLRLNDSRNGAVQASPVLPAVLRGKRPRLLGALWIVPAKSGRRWLMVPHLQRRAGDAVLTSPLSRGPAARAVLPPRAAGSGFRIRSERLGAGCPQTGAPCPVSPARVLGCICAQRHPRGRFGEKGLLPATGPGVEVGAASSASPTRPLASHPYDCLPPPPVNGTTKVGAQVGAQEEAQGGLTGAAHAKSPPNSTFSRSLPAALSSWEPLNPASSISEAGLFLFFRGGSQNSPGEGSAPPWL